MSVIGVGYEGHTIESFLAGLVASGIGLVADVRLTPMSRQAGFSKRGLAATLADQQIHKPRVGW